MNTIRRKPLHSTDFQRFHLEQASKWAPGGHAALTVLRVRTWCGQAVEYEKGAFYGAFDKEKHVSSVCMKCVRTFVAWKRAGRPDLSPAPVPPSAPAPSGEEMVDVANFAW